MGEDSISFKTKPVRIEEEIYSKIAELSEVKGLNIKQLLGVALSEWLEISHLEDEKIHQEIKRLMDEMLIIKRKLQLLISGRLQDVPHRTDVTREAGEVVESHLREVPIQSNTPQGEQRLGLEKYFS